MTGVAGEDLTPDQEIKILVRFHALYTKLVKELDRERGPAWCALYDSYSEEAYWAARTRLEKHLEKEWARAQQRIDAASISMYWGNMAMKYTISSHQ